MSNPPPSYPFSPIFGSMIIIFISEKIKLEILEEKNKEKSILRTMGSGGSKKNLEPEDKWVSFQILKISLKNHSNHSYYIK